MTIHDDSSELVHTNVVRGPSSGFVLVLSGGGYERVGDTEGRLVSEWLGLKGVRAGYINYVTPPPSPERPLRDVLRALHALRAGAYGLIEGPIAIMGSSAGGHLAGLAATASESELMRLGKGGHRPDLAVYCYPVVSLVRHPHWGSRRALLGKSQDSHQLALSYSVEQRIDAESPPALICHSADDSVVSVENSLALASALKAAGVGVDLHVYARGRHGLGLDLAGEADWSSSWRSALLAWLDAHGIGPATA